MQLIAAAFPFSLKLVNELAWVALMVTLLDHIKATDLPQKAIITPPGPKTSQQLTTTKIWGFFNAVIVVVAKSGNDSEELDLWHIHSTDKHDYLRLRPQMCRIRKIPMEKSASKQLTMGFRGANLSVRRSGKVEGR